MLRGAFPLLIGQNEGLIRSTIAEESPQTADVPIGAKVIRAVRAYDELMEADSLVAS